MHLGLTKLESIKGPLSKQTAYLYLTVFPVTGSRPEGVRDARRSARGGRGNQMRAVQPAAGGNDGRGGHER